MNPHFKRNFFFYLCISVLAIACAYFYLWGEYRVSQLRDAAADLRQEAHFHASQAVAKASEVPLRLMAQSAAWAVRTELLNGNQQEAQRYLEALGRDAAIKAAAVCDTSGTVLHAADIGWRGQPFGQFYPASLLQAPGVEALPSPDGAGYLLAAPIMGLSERLGTLFLHYHAPLAPLPTADTP
jgi:hypothetical protein